MKHLGSAVLMTLAFWLLVQQRRRPASFAMVRATAGAPKRDMPIPPMLAFRSTPMIGSGAPTISTGGASTRAAAIGVRKASGSSFKGLPAILPKKKPSCVRSRVSFFALALAN